MSSRPRIGYVPYSPTLAHPGDHGRFAGYANARGLQFELARREEKYDVVVLTEWADISLWRHYAKGKIVYDLVNSYLAIPRSDIKGCLRGVAKFVSRQHRQLQVSYWEAIRNMCRRSDAVVCASEAQRSYILPFCNNVHVVPDAHYSVANDVKIYYKTAAPIKLVWTGLPSNIVSLREIRGVLRNLSRRHAIEMHVVTAADGFLFLNKWWKVPSTELVNRTVDQAIVHAWDKETAAKIITECDVAVIPIDLQDPMAAGKSQNKLIFLWRMGMPVVTSATPAYTRAMDEAGMSLTCKDDMEWIATLEKLILHEAVRRDAGERGRQYALRHFSEALIHHQWDGVFRSIGFDFAGVSA